MKRKGGSKIKQKGYLNCGSEPALTQLWAVLSELSHVLYELLDLCSLTTVIFIMTKKRGETKSWEGDLLFFNTGDRYVFVCVCVSVCVCVCMYDEETVHFFSLIRFRHKS
jgi:hypothetical protein